MSSTLDPAAEARFFAAVEYAEEFFMGSSNLHRALKKLIDAMDRAGIPYSIVGALALGEYGYRRTTEDVDVLLTSDGLDAFKARYLGRGYVERFPGSKGMRDTQNRVDIDVVITGDYPGDGKPKPVSFPDPAVAAVRGEHVALLPLERLIELKLASGMTAPHRLKDLADVLELIKIVNLTESFADKLDPYVRDKYMELWRAAQSAGDD